MSLPSQSIFVRRAALSRRAAELLDRALGKRWIQCGLFVGSFVLFWLLGSGVAHS